MHSYYYIIDQASIKYFLHNGHLKTEIEYPQTLWGFETFAGVKINTAVHWDINDSKHLQ